jgi:NAD(P)-dependent dehydrogenase (short-subunit alcohol dehydrogenase family)
VDSDWNVGSNAIVVGAGGLVDAVAGALRASGAAVRPVGQETLADEHAVAAMFDAAETALGGRITTVVFADALGSGASTETLDLEAWHRVSAVNLDIRFFCAAELARRCLADGRKGALLHLVSGAAARAEAGSGPGAAAAGGVLNLNMSLAVEWGRDNIRTNIIASGLLDDPGSGRPGELESLATLAAYYCSDYASYITGSVIGVPLH